MTSNYNLHNYTFFAGNFSEKKSDIIEDYISPIFYYLHDKLDKVNSTIYLLEKIKNAQNGSLGMNSIKSILLLL